MQNWTLYLGDCTEQLRHIAIEIHKPYCDAPKGRLEEKYEEALKLVV